MKNQITPGPWTELDRENGHITIHSLDNYGGVVAKTAGNYLGNVEANAKAISAVPEMIAALQEAYVELKEEFESYGRGGEWGLLTKIEAALKKAGAI